jgi:diguanylate cyclase (GGDEF)-like protein
MKVIRLIRENVGWKIGVITTMVLLFVAVLIIVSFSIVQVQLFSKFNLIQILVVLVTLLTLLGILTITLTTNHFIQRPVDRLVNAISRAEGGDLTVRASVESIDEIGELTTKFNEMLRKISELDTRKMKTERDLILAQEELKYKKVLEEKAAIIEKTNNQLERSVSDLSVLYRVSQMISSTIVPEELYNVLIDVVVKTLGFQEFALLIFDEETRRLHVKAAYGFKDNQKIKELSFGLGEGISGRVAESKDLVYIKDTSRDPTYLHYKGEKMEEGSFLSLPIISHNRLLGVMNFSRPGTDAFSPMDIKLLTSLGSQVGVSMENARLYAKTKELSVTDELTHVFNRRHFQTMLQMEWKRAKRFARSVSLLMIDVDYFKRYNDAHGHVEGDRVLQEIAKILSESVREVDTVARYGGEEFAIILTHTTSDEAMGVAEKLCRLIRENPFKCEKESMESQVTISAGVANFPEDADDMETLVDHADIALYQAKSGGRNRAVRYDASKSSGLRVV